MTVISITCPAELNQETGHTLLDDVAHRTIEKGDILELDFSETRGIDSLGGACLIRLADQVHAREGKIRWKGHAGKVADFLDLLEPSLQPPAVHREARESWLVLLGDTGIRFFHELGEIMTLIVEGIYWILLAPFEGRKFRWELFLDEMHEMGWRAIKINLLMNFLLGLTIAMMSAAQLRTFGLDIYVATLVSIAFARELAAIMTATVVAARTGAAITAELANMKVQEEIDALRGMGLQPSQFLLAPKLAALVVVMPGLTAMGMLAGIAGGTLWGRLVLNYRLKLWFDYTVDYTTMEDIVQGLVKSLFFAAIIAIVGCHNGLRVRGGSREVGLATTRAVVMDIFFIIITDMLFALLFYYVLD